MTYQPPSGARDLFPLDVVQKRWIDDRLETVFHRWGYHGMITSTIETLETLMAGGAIAPHEVVELRDGGQGLRPELTASIARAAVTRMDTVTYPQRLCYSANVFRRTAGRQREYYQAGVELLGTHGVMADAEILLLVSDCLEALGLSSWQLLLGEASLTRSLLAPFPAAVRGKVRLAIAALDRITLEALDPPLRDYALTLLDLRGTPQAVIAAVSQLDLDPAQRQRVGELKALIELLEQVLPGAAARSPQITLDLSLIQPFDYYTGIVFEIVTSDARQVLAQGGRYDDLLSLYHPQNKGYPGVGFVVNIDTLQQVLLARAQLPVRAPTSDWLIVPATPAAVAAALTYAHTIRQSTNVVRVELSLDPTVSREALRAIARQREVSRIAWVSEAGTPEIEMVG